VSIDLITSALYGAHVILTKYLFKSVCRAVGLVHDIQVTLRSAVFSLLSLF
jgi:hypothetical protein